jgi:hypothetical protein
MIELLELLFNLSLAFLMLLVFGVLLDATIDHFRAGPEPAGAVIFVAPLGGSDNAI